MESLLGIIQSPVFLGFLAFFGVASLISSILARNPSLKRNYAEDRRTRNAMEVPFQDSEGQMISAERRKQLDRRRARILAMQEGTEGEGRALSR